MTNCVSKKLLRRRGASSGEGATTASGVLVSGMRGPSCSDITASVHYLRTSGNHCEREQPARGCERAAGASPCIPRGRMTRRGSDSSQVGGVRVFCRRCAATQPAADHSAGGAVLGGRCGRGVEFEGMRSVRVAIVGVALAVVAAGAGAGPVLAQWPTTCVALNDIVEAHLGNDGNVGIYQRVFGDEAEAACQNDHRDDVRGVFAWAFADASEAAGTAILELAWPTDCVELNDIVEAHLGNVNNVEIYQRVFGEQAEAACRNDHRADVQRVFAWAFDGYASTEATPARFVSVSTSWWHVCGLRTDGAVECSGNNDDGQATPPAGRFTAVSAGYLHSCGVRADGAVDCWGRDLAGEVRPPAGTFESVSAGNVHTCGLRPEGTVECWGYDRFGQATPPAGAFTAISAGNSHSCGLRPDGAVECWGLEADGRAMPPAGAFAVVSAGFSHTCGVRLDGAAECWGFNPDGRATPPGGAFVSVSAGARHTCGIQTDGRVDCWGVESFGQAPAGTFAAVSAGSWDTCGVRTDGTVACWGFLSDT